MRQRGFELALAVLAGLGVELSAQTPPPPAAALIAQPKLADAAVALFDSSRAVIYFNPTVLRDVGPDVAAFLLAHEEGHLAYRHRRAAQSEALMLQYERQADCYAAALLSPRHPRAVQAAIQYFRSLGSFRADREHPSGTDRAAGIEACFAKRSPPSTGEW